MANRRSYGNNGGGNYNQGNNRYSGGGGGGVNPWQSGTSPGRGGIPSLFNNQSLLNQLASPDSQLALATKILSQILPAAQGAPPSLLSLGGGGGYGNGGPGRFGGGGGMNFLPNSRFRRDDRSGGRGGFNDQGGKNRRQQNDRNRDRKGRNDGQGQRPKPKDNNAAAATKASPEEKKDIVVKIEKSEETAEKMETDEVKKEAEEPLEEYVGIPSKLLHCHVCGKSMWNDVSFDTHVKGRNHLQKMRELDDSYQMQTNLMRQIAAISLKLEEVRRGKRRPYPEQYCKMCDLNFNGMTMFAHRSTEEHQGLKRFIHPSCNLCNADFKARLEYDEHILTPQHLQMEAKLQSRKEFYEKDPKHVQLRQEETKFRFMLEELTALSSNSSNLKLTDDEKKTVADLNLPAWDPDIEYPVVAEQVVPAEGYLCKVCKVFVLSKEAAELHAKTPKHYEVFLSRALDKVNKKKDKDEDKRKNSENEKGEDTNAKRIKVDVMDASTEEEGDAEMNGEAVQTSAAAEDAEDASKETPPQSAESESDAAATPNTPRRSTARRGRGRGRK